MAEPLGHRMRLDRTSSESDTTWAAACECGWGDEGDKQVKERVARHLADAARDEVIRQRSAD